MCGIAGIFTYRKNGLAVNRSELLRMRDHMITRGPDGAGVWLDEKAKVGLAHRRLAILDLTENGAQPMSTPDGRLRIVFNGEIYNYQELRDRLKAKGHVFFSGTDTEILLYAYREYREAMVDHLRGMFAFIIWDEERQGIFLARDHFGIKPLYYHDDGETIRAASQVKAILAGGVIKKQPEPAGHVGFYLWGCVPEPYTLYRNLFAVPAGHTLWVDDSGPRAPRKYFDVAEELGNAAEIKIQGRAEDVLGAALRDSVKHHLISDVPVGVFLSAGMDSATLTALASEEIDQLQAVSLGFDEYRNSLADEVPLAQKIAAHYGCTHHIATISQHDFNGEFQSILHAMDQPSIDGVNTYFVARAAQRAGLKVALSGLGGDELLGGYQSFRQMPTLVSRVRPASFVPGLGRLMRIVSAPLVKHSTSPKYASLFEYGGSYGGAYLLRRGLFMPWELPGLLDGELVKEGWASLQPVVRLDEWLKPVGSPHAKVAALEMSLYMRNMLLRDSDWAGMAHSLEIRTPMVDIALFRALASCMSDQSNPPIKAMLGGIPKRTLPDEILNRPKTGFSILVREWTELRGSATGQRGLRGWASLVLSAQTELPKKRVLIFRIGSLGDTCVAIPAFRLIRQNFGNAEIRVLTNFPVGKGVKAAPLKMVLGESGLVDGYFEYPLGMSSWEDTGRCASELRQWCPDVLIYLMPRRSRRQLLRDYLFFRFGVGIEKIVGLSFDSNANAWEWNAAQQRFEPEAHRLLRNLAELGEVDLSSKSVWDLGIQSGEINQAKYLLETWPGATDYIVCGMGTKFDTKDWGEDRWEEWAKMLAGDYPRLGLVLIGVADEYERSERVARHWCGPALNLCGKLSPRESAGVLRHARCFVGHDSGPMHLAAAVGTPCVAVFSAQDKPGIWFPYGERHQVIYHKTECFGCKLEVCEKYQKKCIRSITVDEVLTATKVLLTGPNRAAHIFETPTPAGISR
jgi:asparagine synthase (glutamine-hydrolysing)